MPDYDGSVIIKADLDTKEYKKGVKDLIKETTDLTKKIEKVRITDKIEFDELSSKILATAKSIQKIKESLNDLKQNTTLESYIKKIDERLSSLREKITQKVDDNPKENQDLQKELDKLVEQKDKLKESKIFNVEETEEFKSLLQEYNNGIEALNKYNQSIKKIVGSYAKLNKFQKKSEEVSDVDKLIKKYDTLLSSLERMQESQRKLATSDTLNDMGQRVFETLNQKINDTVSELDKLNGKTKESLGDFGSNKIDKVKEKWTESIKLIDKYKEEQRAVAQEAQLNSLAEKYDNLFYSLKKLESSKESILSIGDLDNIETEALESFNEKIKDTISGLDKLNKESKDVMNSLGASNFDGLEKIISKYAQGANAVRKYTDEVKKSKAEQEASHKVIAKSSSNISKIYSSLIKKFKSFNSATKSTKNNTNAILKSIQKIGTRLKSIIIYKVLRNIISETVKAVQEGLQNLALYSADVNTYLSNLKSSFTQLRNAIASAFLPILQALTPVILRVTNALVNLFNVIGAVTSRIFTGKSTFIKAKKVQEQYAEALDDTAKSADEASSSLAAFDKIDVLSKDKESADKNSSSGILPTDMFEEVEVPQKYIDFIDKLREKLAPTIEAFNYLKKSMEPLKEFAFDNLINFYNSFLKPVGNWMLGDDGIPKLFKIIGDAVRNTDYSKLTGSLNELYKVLGELTIDAGKGVIELIDKVFMPLYKVSIEDWLPGVVDALSSLKPTLEKLLGFAFQGIIDMWEELLKPLGDFIFTEVVQRVADSINRIADAIDWEQMQQTFKEAFRVIGKIIKDAIEIILMIWENAIEPWIAPVINFLVNDVGGALTKIWGKIDELYQKIKPFMEWLLENVVKPLSKFLANTIISYLKMVLNNCVDTATGIIDGIMWLIDVGRDMYHGFKEWINSVSDFFSNLSQTIEDKVNNIKTFFSNLSSNIKSKVDDMKESVRKAMDTISEKIQGVRDWFSRLHDKASSIVNLFNDIRDAIQNGLNNAISWLISKFEDLIYYINQVRNKLSDLKSKFSSLPSKIFSVFTSSSGAVYSAPVQYPYLQQGDATQLLGAHTSLSNEDIMSPISRSKAVLGDNYKGVANSDYDLSSIKNAFKEAIKESNFSRNSDIVLQIDGSTLARLINPYMQKESNRRGVSIMTGGSLT